MWSHMTGNMRAKYMLTSVLEPLDFQIIQIGLETTVTLACTGATDDGIRISSSLDRGKRSPILLMLPILWSLSTSAPASIWSRLTNGFRLKSRTINTGTFSQQHDSAIMWV